MSDNVVLSIPRRGKNTSDHFVDMIRARSPRVLGVASAFVTLEALEFLEKIKPKKTNVYLLAGISRQVTEPAAIAYSIEKKWSTRVASTPGAIFHPKIFVGGKHGASLIEADFGYIGSANFTGGGLWRNTELGLISSNSVIATELGNNFSKLWSLGQKATSGFLANYTRAFSASLKKRSAKEVEELYGTNSNSKRESHSAANAGLVWTGVESFTGFNFQIEFPKRAGIAFQEMVGRKEKLKVKCDDVVREMKFHFYKDNGMFRLNVPNDVPGIDRAKKTKKGIILVEKETSSGFDCRLKYLSDDRAIREISEKSRALRCIGKTSTREYGWI